MNQLIEEYTHTGIGYNPFLIRNNWQVAQLNHSILIAAEKYVVLLERLKK